MLSLVWAYLNCKRKRDRLFISQSLKIKPPSPLVEIYRLNQDVEIINFSDKQTPPTLSEESVLPGFVLDLASLFNL